ncbi:MAG: GNAT family N-acetyltransferase [Candidatus Thorarchaeota archaeon]
MEITRATETDSKWILRHRVEMFRDMGKPDEELLEIERLTKEDLARGLDERTIYYLVLEDERIVGGCGVSICHILPSNKNPSGDFAYIFNLYIEKEYRRRGFALILMEYIRKECKERGILRLYLHASDQGRGVYEKAGFSTSEKFYQFRDVL